MKEIRVGLFFGGESTEHEISIVSAKSVLPLLDPAKFHVVPIGIGRDGKWRLGDSKTKNLEEILQNGKLFSDWAELPKKIDIAFPCLHGLLGEDGTIQGLFELLNLPYIGCGVLASAVGMDKSIQKKLMRFHGLPVSDHLSFEHWMWDANRPKILEDIKKSLVFPVFVKPCRGGSTIGVTCVKSENELPAAIETAFGYDCKVIAETGVPKAREFELGVIGNQLPEVSVVGEILPVNAFYDYEAKYEKPPGTRFPADIPEKISRQIQIWASMAYQALDCKGFARVDFLATQDLSQVFVGELNTIPGLTSVSAFLKLWEAGGRAPGKVIERLISLGFEHHREKIRRATL